MGMCKGMGIDLSPLLIISLAERLHSVEHLRVFVPHLNRAIRSDSKHASTNSSWEEHSCVALAMASICMLFTDDDLLFDWDALCSGIRHVCCCCCRRLGVCRARVMIVMRCENRHCANVTILSRMANVYTLSCRLMPGQCKTTCPRSGILAVKSGVMMLMFSPVRVDLL